MKVAAPWRAPVKQPIRQPVSVWEQAFREISR